MGNRHWRGEIFMLMPHAGVSFRSNKEREYIGASTISWAHIPTSSTFICTRLSKNNLADAERIFQTFVPADAKRRYLAHAAALDHALCIVFFCVYKSTPRNIFSPRGTFSQDTAPTKTERCCVRVMRASNALKGAARPPIHCSFGIWEPFERALVHVCVLLLRRRGAAERDKGRICADIRGATLTTPANITDITFFSFGRCQWQPFGALDIRLHSECLLRTQKEPTSKATWGEIDTWLEKTRYGSCSSFRLQKKLFYILVNSFSVFIFVSGAKFPS